MSIWRVTFTGIWNNSVTCQNVVHFRDIQGAHTPQQIKDELTNNWLTLIKAGEVTTFAWRNITMFHVGTQEAPLNFPINVQGTDGVDTLGGTQVLCVKWRIHTGFAGRQGRGRIYLPGWKSQTWSAGQMVALQATNVQNLINSIKARYVGVGATGIVDLGVLGRNKTEADFHPADDITLSLTPGIQRRRNLGVGI